MKVLLISPLPPPAGGIATWTELYINSTTAQQHNIKLINNSIIGKRTQNLAKYNFIEEIKRLISIINELKSSIKKEKFDIVHINSSCSKFRINKRLYMCKVIKKKTYKYSNSFSL